MLMCSLPVVFAPQGYHALWPLFRLYRLFNIARCPVETPECLSFLDPALGGGKPPDTLVYRYVADDRAPKLCSVVT